MTTDILDLPGWTVLAKRLEDREYELEAEYTVKPTACQKCGVLDRLYRHGEARQGVAGPGKARRGEAWLGEARPGLARQGKVFNFGSTR